MGAAHKRAKAKNSPRPDDKELATLEYFESAKVQNARLVLDSARAIVEQREQEAAQTAPASDKPTDKTPPNPKGSTPVAKILDPAVPVPTAEPAAASVLRQKTIDKKADPKPAKPTLAKTAKNRNASATPAKSAPRTTRNEAGKTTRRGEGETPIGHLQGNDETETANEIARLSVESIGLIGDRYAEGEPPIRIGRDFGVSEGTVYQIGQRKRNAAGQRNPKKAVMPRAG